MADLVEAGCGGSLRGSWAGANAFVSIGVVCPGLFGPAVTKWLVGPAEVAGRGAAGRSDSCAAPRARLSDFSEEMASIGTELCIFISGSAVQLHDEEAAN